ncbi:MAG: autotransporter-associated beta strand repeat-containing protein [Kiritimatiellae bacterium]|nr:autotransporter-associated beta strand repeat-containing protein [Kiritimatiellia bacterium]
MKRTFSRSLTLLRRGVSSPSRKRVAAVMSVVLLAMPSWVSAQSTVYFRNGATSGWWSSGDGDENRWYRASDGWDVRREDLADGQWSSSGTKAYVIVVFDNANQPTMTVNALGGAQHSINNIVFSNSTSRSFAQDGGAFLSMGGGSGNAKIEAASGGTGTYTFNLPLRLEKHTEINPVNGTLTINGTITNAGHKIIVWGDNGKTLNLNGFISGSGGLDVNQHSFVNITNNNVGLTGGMQINKGTVRVGGSTNAIGTGSIAVGTNATLELNLNSVWRPTSLTLNGTGTNSNGALRKETGSGDMTWPGGVVINNTASIHSGGGTLILNGTVSGSSGWSKIGAGALTLNGTNSFSGGLTHASSGGRINIGRSSALGSGAYIIGGASTEFDNTSGGSLSIANAFTLSGGSPTFVGSNPLTISGAVSLSGANRTITVTASTLTLSGNISESGSRRLVKEGSGTLTLSGNNAHSGGTELNSGTLNIGHANALGSGTFYTDGGTFDNSSGGALTVANAVEFDGNPTFTGTSPLTISGAGTLVGAATRTLTISASTLTLSGVLGEDSAGRNLTKQGSGTLILSGNNTYSGNTTVSAGTLQIGAGGTSGSVAGNIANSATLIFDRSNDLTYSGVLSGSGTVEKKGVGALTLSGNNTFSGAATISAGTIKLGHASALGTTAGNTTVASGGVLDLNGQTVGAEPVVLNGHGINGGGALINSSGTASHSGTISLNSNAAIGGANQMTLSGVISGANQLTKVGAGTTILSGNNTFTGNAIVSNGALRIAHANALGTGAGTTRIDSGAALELSGNIKPNEAITVSGTGVSGAGAIRNISDNNTLMGTVALAANTTVAVDSGMLGFSNVVSGAYALTKIGSGALTLDNQAHTFSGGLNINEGVTYSQGNASSLGSGTVTIGAASGSANAHLEFSGAARTHANDIVIASGSSGVATITNAGNVSITLSGAMTLNKAVGVSAIGGGSSVVNLNGAISGSGAINADAASGNYINLAGNNSSYTGTLNANGGTVRLSAANSLTSANSLAVASSGTVDVRVGVTVGYLTGTGTVLNNSGSGSTLTLSPSSGTTTFAGSLQNGASTLSLTKSGAGTQVLTGASTYTGNTTISAGTLVMNGTNTSTAATVSSGATLMGSGSIGGLTVSSGGTVRPGANASTIGRLGVSSLTMNNGSSARFKIGDASDTTDRDYINNSGSATISATTTIYLDDSQLSNFNPALSYSWNLIVGGITAAGNFSLDDSTYWSTSKAGGTFSLSASGNNLVLTFTPVAGEPTTQATSIGFSSIGATSMTVSWTSGDGANRIVVARAGSAVNANPSDNSTYTGNATFGSGSEIGTGNFVVYNGSGSSVSVSGLSAGTVYHFRVYEYNGSSGSEDYLTSTATGNPASQTTLASEPTTQATTVTFSSLGNTSMTINWTSGNGANRLVIVRQGSAPSGGPVDGTAYTADADFSGSGSALGSGKVVYQGSGSSVAITGLSASTLYYAQVFEYNGSGASLNYNTSGASGNPGNRYTLAAEPTGHASAFSASPISASQIDLSWTAAAGPPSGYIIIQRAGAAPTGAPSDGTSYTAGNTIGDGTVAAIVTPGSATSASITGLSGGTTYHFVIMPFNWDGSNNQTYNYRTAATIPSASATTYASEPSTQATSITFPARTKSSIDVSWTSGNGANRVVVAREGAAVNSDPVDGTGYTANATFGSGTEIGTGNFVVYSGSGSSFTITGLKTNTTYHFRVYEFNGSSGTANYNVNTASGNPASRATADLEPGIGVGSGISVSTTVGSDPSAGSFVVTNVGGSSLSYVISDDVAWLSVSAETATNKTSGQTQSHTVNYNVAGLYAGVSNATITVTQSGGGENAATNSPRTIPVTLTLNAIPDPTSVSVQGEAPEFNRLFWTKNASYDVMVVHRAGGVPSVPVNNTAYSVGDTYGSSTRVIYKGAAATFEHVVTPGTTNQYAFYSINNNHYSAGVAGGATNPAYQANIVIEQFSYTNGLSISARAGGAGWTNAWDLSSGSYSIATQQFAQTAGYPTMGGNILVGTNAQAYRSITNISSGKLYVAVKFRNTSGSGTEWSGLSFYNGGTELKFLGESYAADRGFTVGSTVLGTATLLPNTDYTMIVMHDFSANATYGNLYTNASQTVPATEPGSWQVTDSGSMAAVNRICLGGNVGMRWDEIRIATNWTALLNLADTEPSLSVTPTNIAISMTKGSVTSKTFTVSNSGTLGLIYTNTITYGSGSGWLSVAPTGQLVGGNGSLINTGSVSAVGMAVGSYVATNRVAGNQTNSPVDVVFNLTVTAISTPTSVSATADGAEMVRLAWTSASDVMIVYRNGADLSADPTDNTAYSVGDLLGGGTVIWKGNASALEHIVATGATHYYRIYAINNNHYSAPASANATTVSYVAGEIVEPFSYTNLVSLGSNNGGSGWSAAWSVSSGTWGVRPSLSSNNMHAISGYPMETGNKIRMADPGDGGSASAYRNVSPISTGKVYIAAIMSYAFRGTSKWAGVSFLSNGVERAYFGKLYASTNKFGLNSQGGSPVESTYELGPFSGSVGSTNNTYLIIARYDFATRAMDIKAYYRTDSVPDVEPGSWDASDTLPAGRMDRFDGIRLSGGSAAGGTIGRVDWDEIRVAQSWAELLNVTPALPFATAYQIGNAANEVTDAQLKDGTFPVSMTLWADSGVESVSVTPPYFKPNFDLLHPTSGQIVTDKVFSSFSYQGAGKTLVASNNTHSTVDSAAIVLGVYTGRWSAISSNAFSKIDAAALSNGTAISFTVLDDDSLAPEPVTINSTNVGGGSARLLHIAVDGTNISANGASSNNIQYTTTDGVLAEISSAKPLLFWLGARDASGLSRGGNAELDSHLSVGSAIISNVTQYDATRSDPFASTMNAKATNVWSWITPLSNTELQNLVTNSAAAGSNAVVMTWRDADNDRPGDQTSVVYTQGWFKVNDDDTTAPTIQNFVVGGAEGAGTVRVDELSSGTGWSITGRVSDSGSGINVNGTETNQPDSSPYFELWDPTGALRYRKAFSTFAFTNGEAKTLSSIGNGAETVSGVTFSDTGVWTARVIVADADADYGPNDHSIGTNEIPFTVIVGASLGGLGNVPAAFAVTSYYGTVSSTNPWPNFVVTNIGSGTLSYDATVSYGGPGGWLQVAPGSGSLTGHGATQIHTNSIDASLLAPGVYTATITLNGNQTNSSKTIAVTLRVFGYYPGEIMDQFTNSTGSLEGMTGGTGWSAGWDNNPDSGYSINSSSLTVPGNYPASAGNKVCGDTSGGTELQTYRKFGSTFSTGKVFVAIAVRKTDSNSDGYHGISFMNGGTEQVFFGKLFNGGNFGIDLLGNGGAVAGNFGVTGVGDPGYFYIGMYDFAENKVFGRAYNNSDTIPTTVPDWAVSNTPTVAISAIDGIRIAAKDEGTFCYDEVRVASSWEGLLNLFTQEPNVHASGLSFREVKTDSMIVGWTPGNGANRIVIAREGSPVTYSPTDSVSVAFNNNYTSGTDLGGGNKIVYNGGGTNVTLTGLNPATRYYFAIYEYNGAPPNYYTNAGWATGDRWTISTEPANPIVTFNAYPASDTTMTNKWSLPGGSPAPDGFLILSRPESAVDQVPVDGVGYTNGQLISDSRVRIVTPGSATEALQTDLTSCVDYYFKIFPFRWNGSNAETYNYLTNSAATATAETECSAPTLQASNIVFNITDTNSVTLSWQRGSGQGVLLVVRGTNAVSQNPVDGTTYTANAQYGSGSHLGGGNYVAYIGTGTTATITGLLPGNTYHFRLYEYNGAGAGTDYNVTTANDNPRSTTTAAFGLVEDKFVWNYFGNYANNNLDSAGTGTGWSDSWSTFGGYVAVDDANSPPFKGYPADTRSGCGNNCDDSRQVKIATVSGTGYGATRHFPARTSGKLYAAVKINIQDTSQTSAWAGISFYSNATEVAFLGKGSGFTSDLALSDTSTTVTNDLSRGNSNWQLYGGNPYLIVIEYDFDNKTLRGMGISTNLIPSAVPEAELGWQVEMTNVNISSINGIRLAGRNVGDLIFDHIRIGPTWESTIWNLPANWHQDNGPVPTLVYIGTNYNSAVYDQVITNLSDAELKSSQLIDFAIRWNSSDGVFLTNSTGGLLNQGSRNARVSPNWDPLAVGVASNQFNLDRYFTNFFGQNGATVVTTYQKNAFSVTNIDFETRYFVTVSAETFPGGSTVAPDTSGYSSYDRVPVNRAITINEALRFYVYDDDTNSPAMGARAMRVLTNVTPTAAQSAGDGIERHFVYDGDLGQMGMRVSLGVYDTYSGLQRSSSGNADTNMTVTIPFVTTNNNADFKTALSSADTKSSSATSLWEFASSVFTWQRISDMWGGDGTSPQGQDLSVTAHIPDADDDRVNDQMWTSNQLMGFIRVLDDDVLPPEESRLDFAGAGAKPFYMNTNGYAIGSGDTLIRGTYPRRSGTGSNTIFAITDEELAKSSSRSLQFVFGSVDSNSGVARGISGTTNSIMSFSVGGDIISGVTAGWNASLSTSLNQPGVRQTNVWTFSDGYFSGLVITQLMNVTGSSGSGSNRVAVTIPDVDNDRTNDMATLYDRTVGWLQVFDDDINGPVMSLARVSESEGGGVLLSSSFETNQGWLTSYGSGTAWTNNDGIYGNWVGVGVNQTSLDPKNTGTRRIGLLTNGIPEPQPYIQLPPVNNPGRFSLYAARVGSGSGDPMLRLEWRNGSSWESLGDQVVPGTTYQPLTWDFELESAGVTLRVTRVNNGEQRSQVYLDDFAVNSIQTWIGTNDMTNGEVHVSWEHAVDDYSNVKEYRVIAPIFGSVLPTSKSEGSYVNPSVTSQTFSIEGQGVITGYVFAVDSDDDRADDDTMGNVLPLLVKVDTNPPPRVIGLRATDAANDYLFDPNIDESSEIKVEWTPGGTNVAQAAGWRQVDNAPLSGWDTFIIRYYEVHDTNGVPVANAITTTLDRTVAAWSNVLNNWAFTNLVLSNLQFDAHYKIEIQASDRAGNIGLTTSVVGNTDRFLVTQGVTRVNMGLDVRWTGPTNEMITRDYDVIYVDSANGFRASLSNSWEWLTYTNHPRLVDYGGTNRLTPGLLTGTTYRLYRVAKQDRWRTNQAQRSASVEIYAAKGLRLHPGENWYSLFSLPDPATTNEVESTVAYTFGTNTLPAGSSYATSARIAWFGPTIGATNFGTVATSVVWLSQSDGWQYSVGGSGAANSKRVPLGQGFMIELPLTASPTNLVLIGRVATQALVRTIPAPMSTNAPEYHLLSQQMTERITVADFMKQFGSFGAGYLPGAADELRVLSNVSTNGVSFGSLRQPRLRIYKSLLPAHAAAPWRYVDGGGSAMSAIIEPDDAIFILRRSPGADIVFTNAPTYPPPTRTMSP